jgi:hypothetical protein
MDPMLARAWLVDLVALLVCFGLGFTLLTRREDAERKIFERRRRKGDVQELSERQRCAAHLRWPRPDHNNM